MLDESPEALETNNYMVCVLLAAGRRTNKRAEEKKCLRKSQSH